MWVFYALIATLFSTSKDIVAKKNLHTSDVYIVAFAQQFFSFLFLFPLLLIVGLPSFQPLFFWGILGLLFVSPVWPLFYMKALKVSPISLSVPMLALVPVFTSILSFVFDRTLPSPQGWLGIVILVVGLYLVLLERKLLRSNILSPFLALQTEKGPQYMLLVALIFSFGAHIARLLATTSSPLMAAFSSSAVGSIGLACLVWHKHSSKGFSVIKREFKSLIPIGGFHAGAEIFTRIALSLGYTPYVVSVLRTQIVWSSLVGWIGYKENFHWYKGVGLMLAFGGLVLILTS